MEESPALAVRRKRDSSIVVGLQLVRSGLADAPIRWIVEDVPKFVGRELRRGNQYDAVILDLTIVGGEDVRGAVAVDEREITAVELAVGECSNVLLGVEIAG